MKQSAIVFDLPIIPNKSGNLCFMQVRDHIPFLIDRVYWVYNVSRKEFQNDCEAEPSEEVIVALAGRFDVAVHDGTDEQLITLDRAYRGLYVPREHTWELRNCSLNTIAFVVASAPPDATGSEILTSPINPGRQIDARESTIEDCAIVELPQLERHAGNITFLRSGENWGFRIRRVYHLTDVPKGASRGGHAHRELHQFVIAANGSFDVVIDDGLDKRSIRLFRPDCALHLIPGIWRELHNFSLGSVCLVIASDPYDEQDYLREYDDFRFLKGR